jgi:hypothetical protein
LPSWWNWQTRRPQNAVSHGRAGSTPADGTMFVKPVQSPEKWW